MDHSEVTHRGFVELYLLGELNPADRESFEQHYFDCPQCADDLQLGATFVDNARAVLGEADAAAEIPPAFRQHRFGLAFQTAAVAAVGLLTFVGYQNIVTIPRLRSGLAGVHSPQVLPTVSLLAMGSRAESKAVSVVPGQGGFALDLEIQGGPEFSGYFCNIMDTNGVIKFSVPITSEQAKNEVRLAIPGDALPPGVYRIAVVGQLVGKSDTQELNRYPVTVQ